MPVKKGKPYKKIIGILVVLVAGLSVLFAIVLREDKKKVMVIKGKIEIASKPDEIKPVSKRAAEKTPAPITKDINKKTQIPPKAEEKDIEYVAKDIIGKTQIPLKTKPVIVPARPIDYNKIEKDGEMRALIQKRKERFGLDKGVDIIIKANESIKIGTITVPMKEILDKIRLKRGRLIIEDLMLKPLSTISHQSPKEISDKLRKFKIRYTELEKALEHKRGQLKVASAKTKDLLRKEIETLQHQKKILEDEIKQIIREEKIEAYGIYVVRENDNIWNIHFSFMKDYFQHKGVLLEPQSDEPDKQGVSSGMGKILKFSEHMVYIYNIKERKLDIDLDLLYPLSKIVIFNMGEVFSLLDQIDYEHVNQIQYDGETIWIPAEQ